MTEPVHDALAARNLAPGRHYADSGYASAALVVSALTIWGIALIAPLLADTSAQARACHGYARADFAVDYDARTVTCPQGKTNRILDAVHPARQGRDRGHLLRRRLRTLPGPRPVHHRDPAAASRCCPATWPKPRPPPETAEKTNQIPGRLRPPRRRRRHHGARPPATEHDAPGTAAWPRPASTTCTWRPPSTSSACRPTGPARRWTGSEPATWHASNSTLSHRTRINHQGLVQRRRSTLPSVRHVKCGDAGPTSASNAPELSSATLARRRA